MKKTFVISFIILVICGSLFAETKNIVSDIETISAAVMTKYCPDKRLSIWDVSASATDSLVVLKGETDNAQARDEFYQQVAARYPSMRFERQIILLPDEKIGTKSYGIVINSVETLRSGPSVFKDIVTQTLRGLPVRILKAESGYYLIKTDDGYLGWVDDDRITVGDKDFLKAWQKSAKVVYDHIEGVVYSRPSLLSRPVADVVLGNRFKIGRKRTFWIQVIFPDGRTGWLPKRFLVNEEEYLQRTPTIKSVMKTAFQLLGRPYLWGAASPKAMDCSGFIQTIFRRDDLLLPRDANMQVKIGTAVDTTNLPQHLQPADLLFWGPRPEKITHVGMYIGNGKFVHCSGEVRINSFIPSDADFNQYLRKNLRAVRRIIPVRTD